MYLFENLDVYKLSVQFAALIEAQTKTFPKATTFLVDKMSMASNAIHQNLADAHSHWKSEQKKDFYWNARTAIQECSGLIEIASKRGLIGLEIRDQFRVQLNDLERMVQALIRGYEDKLEEVSSASPPLF